DAGTGLGVYAGLAEGIDRAAFEAAVEAQRTSEVVHAFEARAGDVIVIPSGRVHAIGAGLLLFEIQQNSDTVYRVFDWNRVGLDGRPRELHVDESLACIDFGDVAPEPVSTSGEVLADCEHFRVERWALRPGEPRSVAGERFALVTVIEGDLACGGQAFGVGRTFLVPSRGAPLLSSHDARVLVTTLPRTRDAGPGARC
ncbi:MAG: mannose-6-phosphate isomerase, partial [Planctomycetota bacterium]